MNLQSDAAELLRALLLALIPVAVYGFWYVVKTKSNDTQVQKQFEDMKRELELIIKLLNERMDRIQRELAEYRREAVDLRRHGAGSPD